jgi:fucose 4-O-acetylase-like acetyltransferase
MKIERESWVDIYKGIAISLIVIGHGIFPTKLHDTLSLFHLPLFFLLAGFFVERTVNRYSLFLFIKNRFVRILLPFMFVSAMFISIQIGFIGSINRALVFEKIQNLVEVYIYASPQALTDNQFSLFLWFFPTFFLFQIVIFIIFKYMKKNLITIFILLLGLSQILYLLVSSGSVDSRGILWGIDKLPFVLVLGILGYYIKKYYYLIEKFDWYKVLIFSFIIFLLIPKGIAFELLSMSGVWIILVLFLSILAAVMIISLSKILLERSFILSSIFQNLGIYSMEILLTHALVHYFLFPLISMEFIGYIKFNILMIGISLFYFPVFKIISDKIVLMFSETILKP